MPNGPDTTWVTPTPPPLKTTVDANPRPAVLTAAPAAAPAVGETGCSLWAGTGIDMVNAAPGVATVVTVPVTARGVGLLTTRVACAFPPLLVPPAQNQADDSAPTADTPVPVTAAT